MTRVGLDSGLFAAGEPPGSSDQGERTVDEIVRYLWREYRSWAYTSRRLKQRITKIGKGVLVMTILGTAIGTLAPLLKETGYASAVDIVAWLGALTLAIAAFLTTQLLVDSEQQAWIKARAIGEGFKSECFKFITGTPPYDVQNAAQVLGDRIGELRRTVPVNVKDEAPAADVAKDLPRGPMTVAEYINTRFTDQVEIFYPRAIQRHRAELTRAKVIAIVVGILAVALSAGTSALGAWTAAALGIITTTAATIATWFQSGRHQQLAQNYQDALDKLRLLKIRHETSGVPDKQFVAEAESVFQAEHAAWLYEMLAPPQSAPAQAKSAPAIQEKPLIGAPPENANPAVLQK
jgi:conflict system pore-forming effector with SLATT domain/uncharacterized protein DUF4231